jgi:hypothetical protein
MLNQIFKQPVPNNILFSFLNNICHQKTNTYYILNKSAYKKADLNNYLTLFCNDIKSYYYDSKTYYLDRHLTYNKFITLIRQICKHNHISYSSKIKYDKSNYEITYYIYYIDS